MVELSFAKRSVGRRRGPGKVLGVQDGPSAVGSSYWGRIVTCPREHALYRLGVRHTGDREALTIGWLFHKALEAYYRELWQRQRTHEDIGRLMAAGHMGERVTMERAGEQAAMEVLEPIRHEDGYVDTYNEVTRLLDSYFGFYRGRDRWRIIAVEEELITNDPPYSARLDLVVHDLDHQCMRVIEHKTARTFGGDQLDGYGLNWQILGQNWLVEEVVDLTQYPRFAGVTVNLTTRHAQPRHLRVEVTATPQHLTAFCQMLNAWQKILPVYEQLGWPPDRTKCAGYARGYGRCQYFDLCYAAPEVSVEEWADRQLPVGYHMTNDDDD